MSMHGSSGDDSLIRKQEAYRQVFQKLKKAIPDVWATDKEFQLKDNNKTLACFASIPFTDPKKIELLQNELIKIGLNATKVKSSVPGAQRVLIEKEKVLEVFEHGGLRLDVNSLKELDELNSQHKENTPKRSKP